MRQLPLIAACLLLPAAAQDEKASGLRVQATTTTLQDVADWRMAELDASPGSELFVATDAGALITFAFAGKQAEPAAGGAVAVAPGAEGRLKDPAHCAMALEPLERDGPTVLLVASPRGVERYDADESGAFASEPTVLAARAVLRVRTGRPVFAPLAKDVNGDGLTDVIVPDGRMLDVWIQSAPEGEAKVPRFRQAASVHVRVSSNESTDAELLSDDLESSLLIPGLRLDDVNGDGREDLLVEDGEKRAFHLVRADGSIPPEPDVAVDLSIFRDTTPRGDLMPGRVLAGSDKAVYESRDLDGDGVPDYVIAHRRKVWVFHGTGAGPQFTEPSTVLKAAEDVTAVLVANLDDDGRPDLLLVKVQVPSLGTLLRGLVSTWQIEVDAVGYQNAGGRRFETTPKWRSKLAFQVPAILSIVKDPDAILSRFEDVGRKFRSPAEGDFDGDGAADVALVSEDGLRLDVWRGRGAGGRQDPDSDDAVLRQVLFEDADKQWDIERLVGWLSTFGERRVALITGGREPDARFVLRDTTEWLLSALTPADIDGDGRHEVVLRYDAQDGSRASQFVVLSWK